jgi:hypothetical protein
MASGSHVPCSLVMVSPGGEAGVGVLPGASRCPCMHGFIWTIERGTKVPLLPEIFDRVAFERELKGNFDSRDPSLRRGAHQKPQTRSRGSGGVRARVESRSRCCLKNNALKSPELPFTACRSAAVSTRDIVPGRARSNNREGASPRG